MKGRKGFVSNSSSSSFIMGVGVVTNQYKFDEWVRGRKIDYRLERLSVIERQTGWYDGPKVNGSYVEMEYLGHAAGININDVNETGTADVVAKKLLTQDDDPLIVWFEGSGPDPTYDDDMDDYNYDDIDIDWFSGGDDEFYEGLNNGTIPGVSIGNATFGGGYDG